MFCVVYEFEVKAGCNESFEQAWAEYTEAIFRVRGSLGSRLHRTSNGQNYVAYAQWPSQTSFDEVVSDDLYRNDEKEALNRMKQSMVTSRKVYQLEMIDNRLREASPAAEKLRTKNL